MSKNLVIVESPAKAKTIEKFLGKDFKVLSSFGHVRDLPSKGMSIDIEHDFKPEYKVSKDKSKVVSELKKAVKDVDTVWLASDEDREGEAIAWHLSEVLGLKDDNTKRIVFHEITKNAILNAIENPRNIDKNLVDAQQARRILDRLVGYELSPVLWKKVKKGLSAGRVQSVAVRLIVEREREIRDFNPEPSFKVKANLIGDAKTDFDSELNDKCKSEDEAKDILNKINSTSLQANSVESKPGKKQPRPPFTTSTLQQEASSKLGYSVKKTMTLAQRLYEAGHITYMRTDSLNLSDQAIADAKSQIESQFGANYINERHFKTKNKSAQEAHEAIRPTRFNRYEAGEDDQQKKLYKLIWQRSIASQMAPADVEKTEVKIEINDSEKYLVAKGEVVVFDGFLKAYGGIDDSKNALPEIKQGESLSLNTASATEVFSRPPARYTEAALVKKLEEMGIGRPSTYAPTISTIQDRGYIVKGQADGQERQIRVLTLSSGNIIEKTDTEKTGSDKGKLLPTDIAEVVNDFLVKHFSDVLDYEFTANVETQFDQIASGDFKWNKMIADFYGPFHKDVEKTDTLSAKDAGGSRILGQDPKTGEDIIARYGRFGPVIQIGEADKEKDIKPRFAPMPTGVKLADVTLEQALEMFKLPRTVGTTKDGKEIISNIGPYGPYVKVEKKYINIGDKDPLKITEQEAREAIENNAKESGPIKEFDGGIKVLKGRYGPYVTDGKTNAPIPKAIEPADISLEQAQELIEKRKNKKRSTSAKKSK